MRRGLPSDVSSGFSQNLFLMAYLILVIKHTLGASILIPWPGLIDRTANTVFICLVIVKLARQHYTAQQLLGIGAVASLCVYSSINAHYSSPILSLLLVISLQDVDLMHVMRTSYRFKAVIILVHVTCYIGRIIIAPESVTYIYRDGIVRHFFLLGHPNLFTAYVVWTCLEFIYVNYERLRAGHIALILLINITFYYFTGSRTGLYTSVAVSLFLILEKCGPRLSRMVNTVTDYIAKYGFGAGSVLSIVLTVVYKPGLSSRAKELWLILNNMLTGRLVFGAYAYHDFGFTWLGRTLNFPEKVYYNGHWMDGVIFDNSYQWLFIVFGSVFLIIISLAFFFTAGRMKNIEKLLVFAYVLYALMENYVVNVVVCFPLLFIGKYLYERRCQPDESPSMLKEEIIPLWKRKSV